jgi:hypothetical protein
MTDDKPLQLLNDIALLLVTKAKWDACAVTMRLTNQRVEFFFAKNAPCHRSLESYISKIKQIIAASSDTMEEQLITLILETCIETVRSRIQKVQRTLVNHPQLCSASHINPESKELCQFRKKWQDMNDAQIIASFLTSIRNADLSLNNLKSEMHNVMMFTRAACMIGSVAHDILINCLTT